MRVVVTGGAGFIGSHLVDLFLSRGDDVLVVDSLVSGRRENLTVESRLIVADIRSETAAAAIEAFAPDVLCHFAAQMNVRQSVIDPAYDADVNVTGLVRTLEAAWRGRRLQHVLFASSGGAVYGTLQQFPPTEDHPIHPDSPYGLSKYAGELYVDLFRRSRGVRCTSLRFANVYGPRQTAHGEAGVVAIFADLLGRGEIPTIFGDGTQTRDFVFVDDVVDACGRALEGQLDGTFNVGTGIETDVNTVFAAICAVLDVNAVPRFAPARSGELQRSLVDPQKLEALTQFRPRVLLKDGLRRTLA